MNEEKHLPYWQLVNKKGKVVMVPKTISISTPKHRQRCLYLYHINYYEILKEYLQLLNKLQPKYSQVPLDKISVLKLSLVEVEFFFH